MPINVELHQNESICLHNQYCQAAPHANYFAILLRIYNVKHVNVKCIPLTQMQALGVTRQVGQISITSKAGSALTRHASLQHIKGGTHTAKLRRPCRVVAFT